MPTLDISTSWVADADTWRIPDTDTARAVLLHSAITFTAHPSGQILITAVLGDPDDVTSVRNFQIPLEIEDAARLRSFLGD